MAMSCYSSFSSWVLLGFTTLATLTAANSTTKFTEYILAPPTRIVQPISIYQVNGSVSDPEALLPAGGGSGAGTTTFQGPTAYVTYDFGKNVAGWVSFGVEELAPASGGSNGTTFTVTFTESSLWISPNTSDGIGDPVGNNPPMLFNLTGPGNYTAPREYQRGAFRYLTLSMAEPANVTLSSLSVNFSASPTFENLQNYSGYFHSDDELLNRIWYAGAYTNQLCIIDPTTGDALMATPPELPFFNFTIANGSSVLTDGAKRDRLVWPGDMAVALPSIAVSTYDLISVTNGLDSLFQIQEPDGQLHWSGIPFSLSPDFPFSFTYHLYTLNAVYDYYQWTGDLDWVATHWDAWKLAMRWSLGNIDDSGLMNVTSSADWLRFGMGAYNVEANSILYHSLAAGISLATAMNDNSVISDYESNRTTIKAAINNLLWNEADGLYNDNTTTTLHPQDGNVWAIMAGVPENNTQIERILSGLKDRWTPFGPPAVEAGPTVSPFISSFELVARMQSNDTQSALDLMRFMWGDFMLDDPRMTNSTFIEGYSTNGSLIYAPYPMSNRISYTHGWATGPTNVLTNWVAGIQMVGPAGSTWLIQPHPGNLTNVEAGLTTTLGHFDVAFNASGEKFNMTVSTPPGTKGTIAFPLFSSSNLTMQGIDLTFANGSGVDVKAVEDSPFVLFPGLTGDSYVVNVTYVNI